MVPGPSGLDGHDGTNGTPGASAFGEVITGFTMPAIGGVVVVEVDSTAWMVPMQGTVYGQALVIEFAGTLFVALIVDATHVQLFNPGFTGNAPAGVAIPAGARIGVGGVEGTGGSSPTGALLAANNLSDLTNIALALSNLGLNSAALQAATAFLATANNLSDVPTKATARTNLGLAIGSDVQAFSAFLAGLVAAGPGAADKIPYLTAANTFALFTATSAMRTLLASATNAALLATLNIDRTPQDIIILRDQKASGTEGGTFTSGAWQTRDLTSEVVDTGNQCVLAANQFTLSDGVYRIIASAPGHRVDHHQIRLFDVVAGAPVTEAGILAYGGDVDSDTGGDHATVSSLLFRFTVTGGPKAYEIQHRCQTTRATDGFGHANSFGGPEIYTQVRLERETI